MYEDVLIWTFGTKFTFHLPSFFLCRWLKLYLSSDFEICLKDPQASNSTHIFSKAQVLHHPAMPCHLTPMHGLAEIILIEIAKACGLREQAVLYWSCKKVCQALDLSTFWQCQLLNPERGWKGFVSGFMLELKKGWDFIFKKNNTSFKGREVATKQNHLTARGGWWLGVAGVAGCFVEGPGCGYHRRPYHMVPHLPQDPCILRWWRVG